MAQDTTIKIVGLGAMVRYTTIKIVGLLGAMAQDTTFKRVGLRRPRVMAVNGSVKAT
jgi:hypothetical protein